MPQARLKFRRPINRGCAIDDAGVAEKSWAEQDQRSSARSRRDLSFVALYKRTRSVNRAMRCATRDVRADRRSPQVRWVSRCDSNSGCRCSFGTLFIAFCRTTLPLPGVSGESARLKAARRVGRAGQNALAVCEYNSKWNSFQFGDALVEMLPVKGSDRSNLGACRYRRQKAMTDTLNSATRVHFIVGDPIAQVKVTRGCHANLQRATANAVVVPAHVANRSGALVTRRVWKKCGWNLCVTVPHEFACCDLCDSTSDRARFCEHRQHYASQLPMAVGAVTCSTAWLCRRHA